MNMEYKFHTLVVTVRRDENHLQQMNIYYQMLSC